VCTELNRIERLTVGWLRLVRTIHENVFDQALNIGRSMSPHTGRGIIAGSCDWNICAVFIQICCHSAVDSGKLFRVERLVFLWQIYHYLVDWRQLFGFSQTCDFRSYAALPMNPAMWQKYAPKLRLFCMSFAFFRERGHRPSGERDTPSPPLSLQSSGLLSSTYSPL